MATIGGTATSRAPRRRPARTRWRRRRAGPRPMRLERPVETVARRLAQAHPPAAEATRARVAVAATPWAPRKTRRQASRGRCSKDNRAVVLPRNNGLAASLWKTRRVPRFETTARGVANPRSARSCDRVSSNVTVSSMSNELEVCRRLRDIEQEIAESTFIHWQLEVTDSRDRRRARALGRTLVHCSTRPYGKGMR
jgi:hypothetical protein